MAMPARFFFPRVFGEGHEGEGSERIANVLLKHVFPTDFSLMPLARNPDMGERDRYSASRGEVTIIFYCFLYASVSKPVGRGLPICPRGPQGGPQESAWKIDKCIFPSFSIAFLIRNTENFSCTIVYVAHVLKLIKVQPHFQLTTQGWSSSNFNNHKWASSYKVGRKPHIINDFFLMELDGLYGGGPSFWFLKGKLEPCLFPEIWGQC